MPDRQTTGFAERWPFYATIGFIFACLLLGGASRHDVVQHALLRPLAIMLAVGILCFAPRIDWRAIRWPGTLLLALALIMLVQLVPLPWSWWTALPGRELARAAMGLIGATGAAHELSLTPDRTLNSLFALSVPAAVLLAMAALDPADRHAVLPWLAGAVVASMLLGLAQLVGLSDRLYLYRITNLGSAVGFFANRNHNAALIAAALPLAACLATWPLRNARRRPILLLLASGTIALALLAILSIGSRWGLVLAVLGLAWALVIAWPQLRQGLGRRSPLGRIGLFLVPLLVVGSLAAAAVLSSRNEAVRRLAELTLSADSRLQTLPTTLAMMRELFPFGSGFGSFEFIYRAGEPGNLLSFQYLNHAHNDYVELLIEAGGAGLALLVAALGWYCLKLTGALRQRQFADKHDRPVALTAGAIGMIAIVASIADYPLRTPIWMMVLAISAVWLGTATRAVRQKSDG